MKRTPRNKTSGPEVIRKGLFTAKLYASTKKVDGKAYPIFRLAYLLPGGERKVRDFSTREKAVEEAGIVATAYAAGRPSTLSYSTAELAELDACNQALEGTGLTLWQAVQSALDLKRRQPAESVPVPDAVAAFLLDREAKKVSPHHLRDLAGRLGAFAKAFPSPLSSITADLVAAYVDGLTRLDGTPHSAVSRRNVLRQVAALFGFARRKGWVTRDHAEAVAEIEAPRVEAADTEVFTPDEMVRLLGAARAEMIPAFTIGAFCGLRSEELIRLDWSNVKLSAGELVVSAGKSKTGARRTVTLPPNLIAWVTPHAQASGPVVPQTAGGQVLQNQMRLTADRAGVVWVRNGLRHSALSYRLAVDGDITKLALESGNSAQMIHRHYKSLVSKTDGKAWFDIRPTAPANVIQLPSAKGGK